MCIRDRVAAVSSGDDAVGQMVADAMDKVSNDGVITIEESKKMCIRDRYMRAGVMVGHRYEITETGVAQGGPLSPLLSNIMLNELDKDCLLYTSRCV